MTSWRVSLQNPRGGDDELVVLAEDVATIGELELEIGRRGYQASGLQVDGIRIDSNAQLAGSVLRHGSRIGPTTTVDLPPGAGMYVVAIAGPDTGRWIRLTEIEQTVGRSAASIEMRDSSLSAPHFAAGLAPDGSVYVRDLGSTNGTTHEGQPIGSGVIGSGSYFHAGSTTFGVVELKADQIPVMPVGSGPTQPFQRRFRDALEPLPSDLKHPAAPSERSAANRRPLFSFLIPIITAAGMAWRTGRYEFLLIIALGPIFFAIDGIRRRKIQEREELEAREDYESQVAELFRVVSAARLEELRRDRWGAVPAGLAALLGSAGHERLWERASTDDDFCSVAVGLHDRPSLVSVESQPDDVALPLDQQWGAVLRHSLLVDGALAIRGPMPRARAAARSLLLDLATSQSPNDVKIWVLTDENATAEWNAARWLPHTFVDSTQNLIFSTPSARASALGQLRSIITERTGTDGRGERAFLPAHIVVLDCLDLLDAEEVTDLLVDGYATGVIGLTVHPAVTPEGSRGELTLGSFSDEADFVSRVQPRTSGIRSFEMTPAVFEATARRLAPRRPAGSGRGSTATTETIRLVDIADAVTDPAGVNEVITRWYERGGVSRVPVGGLGDMTVSLDIVRDGPHGLIGGTTRSGKTEFLKSLITALAVANHPDDMSIVIVDFKGGVDHKLSARLPHVVGLSTNHDIASFSRTVQLVEAELLRRQRLMDAVGESGVPNFDSYQKARETDATLTPLPRLLIIIDEFSELLSSDQGRESIGALESITRVGGGLGVHLLLVTQNFENQLPSQIAANAGMRICFRVQDESHSKVVLNSGEAATIPKERIGRAFLRSHGGRAIEFQGARVAGPLPGRETASSAVSVRTVPFSVMSEPPDEGAAIVDVKADDSDMYAVIEVLRDAAARTGWTGSAVPWPSDLPAGLEIGAVVADRVEGMEWPIGLMDEPDMQRQVLVGFETHGSNALLLGGANAGLGDVVRSLVSTAAMCRGASQLHAYVIDMLGQGLGPLRAFPHVGGVAERNEQLALRMLRLVGVEAARRKSRLAALGLGSVKELQRPAEEGFVDLVLVLHGADRLILHGESDTSPLLAPMLGLLSETPGTGVRVIMTGPPNIAHHRLGSSIGQRYIFECADKQDYGAVGVPREFHTALNVNGRAFDVQRQRLIQIGRIPSSADVTASEVIRALGSRLVERETDASVFPSPLSDLPWPLPVEPLLGLPKPTSIVDPVVLGANGESGDLLWLDAEEDGRAFAVTGSSGSGRSTALTSAAMLMRQHGWETFGMALSRRSPMATGVGGLTLVSEAELEALAQRSGRLALFVDDIHKWTASTSGLEAIRDREGPTAIVVAGPVEFFANRSDITRAFSFRTALVLAPRAGLDASSFGIRRLSEDLLRDDRSGRGVLIVSGELTRCQVPVVAHAK